MAKFQLWSRDEYGQGSIIFTNDDLKEIIKKAKETVTVANVNNALTVDDRERAWEMYFPVISSGNNSNNKKYIYLYGGRGALNKEIFYAVNKKTGDVSHVSWEDIKDPSVGIYLGNISTDRNKEVEWMAKNYKSQIINKIDDAELNSKTMLFIKVV